MENYPYYSMGVGKGGRWGSDDPPFLGANFIHFLHKVLGARSVQKEPPPPLKNPFLRHCTHLIDVHYTVYAYLLLLRYT